MAWHLPRIMKSWIRNLGISIAAGALLVTAVPAAVSAAPLGIRFGAGIGDCNFSGSNAGNRQTILLVWKDKDGNLKSPQTVKSDKHGNWNGRCDSNEVVEVGDTIKATIGTKSRTFQVPELTVDVDRVTNVVSGLGPANDSVSLYAYSSNNNANQDVSTDPSGAYSYDFTSQLDITGDGWAEADWSSPSGDYVYAYGNAQYVQVWEGRAPYRSGYVEARPGQAVSVDLLDGSLVQKASSSGTANRYGYVNIDFLDANGNVVQALAGDTIDATDVASDATWVLPAISVSGVASTNRVSGTCLPNDDYYFEAYSPQYDRDNSFNGVADSAGNFSRNITHQMDLQSGDHIDVFCTLSTGDEVARHVTVP